MQSQQPLLSVIVPMFNAAATIERCLAPLLEMLAKGQIEELIVVDDGATDRSPEMASSHAGVRLLRMPKQAGPGGARNLGVEQARGSHVWFVDSDVIVRADAAAIVSQTFTDTGAGAVFGCYDDTPDAQNFLSQYKNLVHRYYHSRGNHDASTFWAGCGAVERSLYIELGGFDAERYRYPSIEDIELGYRIAATGRRIVLRPELQGKHLKIWRLKNLLHTEVFRRAIPWSMLMLERKHLTNDLNVSTGERLRAVLSLAVVLTGLSWAAGWLGPWPFAIATAVCVAANRDLLQFFVSKRGPWFGLRAFAYHQFYYLYSSAAFAYSSLLHLLRGQRAAPPGAEAG